MTDLLRSALHAAGDAADPAALPPPAAVRARGRQRTRRTTLAAAAGAMLAGSAVAVLLTRPADTPSLPPEPAPSPTMTTPAPTASSTTPTTSELSEDNPTRVYLDTGPFRFSVQAIAEREGRFVLVGDSSDHVRTAGPAVYWSDDGLDWRPARSGEAPESINVTDVVATPSGFVAVGLGTDGAAAWTSQDGRVWTPATVTEPPGRGRTSIWGLSATRLGLFATGFHAGRAHLWQSSDGRSWTPAPGQDAFDVPGSESLCAVRDAASGLVATAVVVPDGTDRGRMVTWTSADGSSWSRRNDRGEPVYWCDQDPALRDWEARNDEVLVTIDPNSEGDFVWVTLVGDARE